MNKIILDDKNNFKRIHFIGIGGVNMNSLAQILNSRGYIISGSDQNKSIVTDRLISLGIKVYIGHDERNISDDTDLVVHTAAVKKDNPEFICAQQKGIKIIDRAKLLGMIMKNYKYPICISGTHGKTTATSMISEIFMTADKDPTILVGGYLDSIKGVLKDDGMDYMIVESCEYYDSFLSFYPFIGIILNLEADHLDYFKDIHGIRKSFKRFAERIPEAGALIINSNIDNYVELTKDLKSKVITFGINNGNWTAKNIYYSKNGFANFDAYFDNKFKVQIELNIPGEYNILNALSAIATSYELGVDLKYVKEGFKRFSGARRRFQYKGKFNDVAVIDDYAHHPTEIKATLHAIQNKTFKDLWCIFQPHTHSRTKVLLKEFSECFEEADKIIITDIYSPTGREEESTHIHSKELVDLIKKRGKEVYYLSSFTDVESFVKKHCKPDDLLITMGAGDVYLIGENLVN